MQTQYIEKDKFNTFFQNLKTKFPELTMTEFASTLGISRSFLSMYLSGKRNISEKTQIRMILILEQTYLKDGDIQL